MDQRSWLLLTLTTCVACEDQPQLTWHGEHLNYAAETPERVCAGTREYLDARAGELIERFESGPRSIDYFFVESLKGYCESTDHVTGCGGAEIHSLWALHEHELVHAARDGFLPLALEEGLATYWGDHWPIDSAQTMAPREEIRALLEAGEISGVSRRNRMAHFVAFLVEGEGWPAIIELDGLVDRDSTIDEIDQALLQVYGSKLDGLLASYDAFPDCDGFVNVDLACEGPAIELGQAETELVRTVDCYDETGLGPSDGLVFVEERIEILPAVSNSRWVGVEGEGLEAGGRLTIRACGPCSAPGVGVIESSAFVVDDLLPPGKYVVRFQVPEDAAPAELRLTIGN